MGSRGGPPAGHGAPRSSDAVVRLEGVTRRFGDVVALVGADLTLLGGEVHGVLGANGAGKTTLLKILGGLLRPDGGRVVLDGRDVRLTSPRDAWAHGVALVHQHFTLVPTLTVLENLALGSRRGSGMRLDLDGVREAAGAMSRRTGLVVPLDARVEEIGVGDRQRAEILKALLRAPRVLVLDEPTAVLTPPEIEGLFGLLASLAEEGRAVALVAHKLDEVLAVADRITVLRDGRTVLTAARPDTGPEELVRAMIAGPADDFAALGLTVPPEDPASGRMGGRAQDPAASGTSGPFEDPLEPKRSRTPARRHAPASMPAVARLVGVEARSAEGALAVDRVDLEVRRGEIVGVAGVEGNGQHQLALVLSGRVAPTRGVAELPLGIGFIPQDRTVAGVVPTFDLTENLALALQRDGRFRRGPWLRWDALADRAAAIRERYDIAAPGVTTRVAALSGGNQQRLVVGRELAMATDLLVAENPTRGLDVAATAFVHRELLRLIGADGGSTEPSDRRPGVVLVSTDLDEVLALSGRVFAMSRGRLVAVPEDGRSREDVGALMLAGTADA